MTKTKEIPIIEITPGEVFLQDTVVDDEHCYICKKEFNKFDDKDMLLLRVNGHKMGFCCPHHAGIVQEFIKQYKMLPGGWNVHEENNSDIVDVNVTNVDPSVSTRKN